MEVQTKDRHEQEVNWLNLKMVNRTQNICPTCTGLDQCDLEMGPRGYMVRKSDDEGDAGMPYDVFRAKPCPHQFMAILDGQLGKRFAARRFETFRQNEYNREAYEAAFAYAVNYRPGKEMRGLLFSGGTGVGKTHLAASVLRRVVLNGEWSFRWVSMPQHDGSLYSLAKHRFLVLDDFTELALKGFRGEAKRDVFSLVNTRYEADMPMVVTTRMNEAEMREVFGGEVVGRLLEMCDLVVIEGRSWRGV